MTPSSNTAQAASILERLTDVRGRIARAEHETGRMPGSVTLTVVSKTQNPQAIDAVLSAGLRVFGENRVQEAQGRWQARRADLTDLELRLIGPLQTNKAEDAVALFDAIETLDREKLARAVAEASQKLGRTPQLLVQVNMGAEPQKAGVLPDAVDDLVRLARETYGLNVRGMMCIPPAVDDPVPHFESLRILAVRNGLSILSMGMSGDYEAAIAHGATHVRVGSALFGERNPRLAPSTV